MFCPNPCGAYARRGQCVKDGIESKDPPLINNRQAGRRNRGRNNGRPNNGGNRNGESGNRIDSRARGNAPQLLEKYRNLARDAQLAGDRVNTEYYLQFADHYFRVIADNRARQEEQQARYRRPDESFEEEGERGYQSYDDGGFAPTEADRLQASQQRAEPGDGLDTGDQDAAPAYAERGQRQERPRRDQREYRDQREPRQPRFQREDRQQPEREHRAPVEVQSQPEEQPQPEAQAEESVARAPRGRRPNRGRDEGATEPQAEASAPRTARGRPRRSRDEDTAEAPGLDLAVLPPSISRADNDAAPAAEEAPAPKRRGRPRKTVAEAAE